MAKSAPPTVPTPLRVLSLGAAAACLLMAFLTECIVIQRSCRSSGSILTVFELPQMHCRPGRSPFEVHVLREEPGCRVATQSDRAEWEALNSRPDNPSAHFRVWCEPLKHDTGIWAATSRQYINELWPSTYPVAWPAWADRDVVRLACADFLEQYSPPPMWRFDRTALSHLRKGEGVVTESIPLGYLHNTLSLLPAIGTIWSARRWWIERTLLARHRARPGMIRRLLATPPAPPAAPRPPP